MANANPQQPQEGNIQVRWNARQKQEHFTKGQHVNLQTLRERDIPEDPMMRYLELEMPPYPTPVEFWVSDVAHVTVESGFKGILASKEFKPGAGEFSWWSLKTSDEEISAAERRYWEENFPNQAQELNEHQPFLKMFTTSPVFQNESRYGNYRFTFHLAELMEGYKEQNCGGEEPVLRVYETVTYKQEIMYTVLIHSPEDNECFREYPLLLGASEWVRYQDGKIIWKAQAICGTHQYQFVEGEVQMSNAKLKYYVWDHVCLVFHLPKGKRLKIPKERLINALDACAIGKIDLTRYKGLKSKEDRFLEASIKVSELKDLGEE